MRDPKGPVKPYKSPQEIATQHKVPLAAVMKQVKMGTKVEGEHTTSKSGARITALQHVDELPNYYTKLKKVEKKTMKKEDVSVEQQYQKDTKYCLLCRKNEKRHECGYGPQMWDRYSIAKIHPTNEAANPAQQAAIAISMKKEGKKPKNMKEDHVAIAMGKMLDSEGSMIMSQLDQIEMAVEKLRKLVKDPQMQVPAWVQSKITMATDYIDTAADYMSSKDESFEMEEGMTMDDFITARKKRERSAARKELSPTRRAGIHTPEKAPERASRRDAAHGETGHGGKLRPNKVRKAKALGELGEEVIDEKRGLWDNIHARRKAGKPPKKPGEKGYPKTLDIDEGLKQARKNVGASKCWPGKVATGTKMKGGREVPDCKEDTCSSFSQFMQIAEDIRNPERRAKLSSIMDREVRKGDKSKGENPRKKYHTKTGKQALGLLHGGSETGSPKAPVRSRGGGTVPSDERVVKSHRASNREYWAGVSGPSRDRGAGSKAARRAAALKKEEVEIVEVAAWQRKEGKNPTGGLNEKGRKSYERENPGSNLQAPQPEGGPRKRSFCARMGGMPGPMKDEKGRPTRKALALRKWKC